MSVADLQAPGVRYAESPLETRRFGFEVARLTIGDTHGQPRWTDDVAHAVRTSEAEVIVTRWGTRNPEVSGLLAQLGRRVIPADNLTYWEASTQVVLDRCGPAGTDCRVGGLDGAGLDALVLDMFADYPSHYSANPLFRDDLALAGYREWAEHTRSTSPDLVVSLHDAGKAIGVATCAIDDGDLDILLAGIASEHQGGGRYATLLGGVARLAARQDIDRIIISTQAGNVNVQRAWVRAGFLPFAVFATAHLVRVEQ